MELSQQTDLIFSSLSDPFRRWIVTIVTEIDEPITSYDLAREIAIRSGQLSPNDADSNLVDSILIELYHYHLPKLVEADLIQYDPDVDIISTSPITTHLTALIQIAYSIAEIS